MGEEAGEKEISSAEGWRLWAGVRAGVRGEEGIVEGLRDRGWEPQGLVTGGREGR